MTHAEDTLSSEADTSTAEQVAASGMGTPTAESHSVDAVLDDGPGSRGRHSLRGGGTTVSRQFAQDRRVRLLLVAESLIGVGCLVLAYGLHPSDASPFAMPSNAIGWFALIVGVIGIWLVPGLWLSAAMMRTGVGPVARLATRIGATLTWYALVGPVIHLTADGALVTRGGVVGVTVAATVAVCLGMVLGLARWPSDGWLRLLTAGAVGAFCGQTVIWLCMWLFTDGVNYEQIRRLDWLIVLSCGLLTAMGSRSRPDLPMVRTARNIQPVLISLAVVAVIVIALLAVGSKWSPAQRMPSAFGIEQVAAPPNSDVAFALSAIGPDGPAMIQRADFVSSDDTGRPVAVSTRLLLGGTADPPTLLMVLDPTSRPQLCEERTAGAMEQGWPIKLTVRDQVSGLVVQAVVPAGWCVT